MTEYAIPVFATMAGAFVLIRNLRLILNEQRLLHYLQANRKGKMWVKKFGMEKTQRLTKKYFLPIGCVMGAVLLSIGLFGIVTLLRLTS